MAYKKILAFILAGGRGERLEPLTNFRSKPSVPFGGRYRIVDFALSNFVNSQIYSIYLLVQYKSQSLIEHVRQNWVLSPIVKEHFITVVPPQMRMGTEWFQGTADAVSQNINLIYDQKPELVAVFGADHIYRMDIRQMIDFHLEQKAAVTVAARPVPLAQASSFGVILTDREKRITGFQEKPAHPSPMTDDPDRAFVSMGNYLFDRDVLLDALAQGQMKHQHDFGTHLLPNLVGTDRVFAYDFDSNIIPGFHPFEERGYWRDVGSIPAFYDANMDTLGEKPIFELHNKQWPIHPAEYDGPSAKILRGDIQNSFIAEGVIVRNARIVNSVIRRDVMIDEDVVIEDSIIMDHSVINRGCRLRKVIVDKFNVLASNERIGYDTREDALHCACHRDPSGISIIPKGERMPERPPW